jgi:creatinine amidohydrolase
MVESSTPAIRLAGLHLERMTSPEVGQAIASGSTTVVFACGAVEQHGPHLPMFMDAEHGTRLAEEVARRLGKALVAPTIRIGCSEHHMAFTGSMTLRTATFEAVCTDYCTSLARHGFERICIIPTHGGNFVPIHQMLPRLREAVGNACSVLAATDLLAFIALLKKAVAEAGGMSDRVGGHADIAESSIMLAMHPDLVHPDLAEDGFHPELEPDVVARILRDGFRSVTPNGILGDARGMNAAIGEACITYAADRLAEWFDNPD